MKKIIILIAIVVYSLLEFVNHANAEDKSNHASEGLLPIPSYDKNIWDNAYLSGNWGGTRTDLANNGAQFSIDWTQSLQKITNGGLDRNTGYNNTVDFNSSLDLMRMGVLPGALITFRAESRFGDSINDNSGSILPVNTDALFPLANELDDEIPFTVTSLSYTQFLSEKFGITLGKFDTLDGDPNEFASGRGTSQFMDANMVFNSATALRMPYSTLGAGLIWMPIVPGPRGGVTIKSLIFATSDSSEKSGFDTLDDGLSWITEADTQYRIGTLPGGQNLGFLYSFDQDFKELGGQLILGPGLRPTLTNEDSTWCLYWSAWQYLVVEDPSEAPIDLNNKIADHQGFGLFARAGIADQDTNPIESSMSAGIGGRGVFGRSNDTYGLGYYYTAIKTSRLSELAGLSSNTQGLEAYYNYALTGAIQLTLDLQSIDSIIPNVSEAFVVGGRIRVVL